MAWQLTEEVIFDMYSKDKLETLKYLDLSKSKWRSVEVRTANMTSTQIR